MEIGGSRHPRCQIPDAIFIPRDGVSLLIRQDIGYERQPAATTSVPHPKVNSGESGCRIIRLPGLQTENGLIV